MYSRLEMPIFPPSCHAQSTFSLAKGIQEKMRDVSLRYMTDGHTASSRSARVKEARLNLGLGRGRRRPSGPFETSDAKNPRSHVGKVFFVRRVHEVNPVQNGTYPSSPGLRVTADPRNTRLLVLVILSLTHTWP